MHLHFSEEEDDVPYLVDFQQKYIDGAHQHMDANPDMATTHSVDVLQEINSDDDWYVCIKLCMPCSQFDRYPISSEKEVYLLV